MPRRISQRADGWYLDEAGPFKTRHDANEHHEALSRIDAQREEATLTAEKSAAAIARERAFTNPAMVAALKRATRNPGAVMGRPPKDAPLLYRIALDFYWTKRQANLLPEQPSKRKPKPEYEPALDDARIRHLSRKFKKPSADIRRAVIAYKPLGKRRHYDDDLMHELHASLTRELSPRRHRNPQLRFALNRHGAQDFLREALARGPLPAAQICSMGKVAGLSERTIKRGKKALKVQSKRQGRVWIWALTDTFQGCQ